MSELSSVILCENSSTTDAYRFTVQLALFYESVGKARNCDSHTEVHHRYQQMTSIHDSYRGQVLVTSPRSNILNCQQLKVHLPPLGDYRDHSARAKLVSPPMSASPIRTKFINNVQNSYDYRRHYPVSPTSTRSGSGKQSPANAPSVSSVKSRHYDDLGSTATSTPRTSVQSNTSISREDSNDDRSSGNLDSPEAQHLTAGAPGIARRAKAHVPSACVNCKRKHLACETKRPCNRCVQTGKEVSISPNPAGKLGLTSKQSSCVDVQHKKRGRPRLREEDSLRGVSYHNTYAHPEMFPGENTVISVAQADRPRSKSYRELRSQPDALYATQRPRTSDAVYYDPQQLYGMSSARSSFLPNTTPTVLLTPEFTVAQQNRAFADTLALPYTARGWQLLDLVLPSEREKVNRVQTLLRAELQAANPMYPRDGNYDSRSGMPPIESLDVGLATSGFKTRSEYWTFRISHDQSRGFPISITLARTSTYFVVLTLIQRASPPQSILSPTFSQPMASPGFDRRPSQTVPAGGMQNHRLSYSAAVPDNIPLQLQPSHSLSLEQYSQRSPPRGSISYASSQKTSSPESARSGQVQYKDGPVDHQHLQLPPIRTKATAAVMEPKRRGSDRSQRSSASGKGSPMSASPHSSRKKKRRRVEIGEILH